jgi:hypothetical protein
MFPSFTLVLIELELDLIWITKMAICVDGFMHGLEIFGEPTEIESEFGVIHFPQFVLG